MKKLGFILFGLLWLNLPTQGQGNWLWADREGTLLTEDYGGACVVNANGQVITAGSFGAAATLQLYFDGPRPLILTCRDTAGSISWQQTYGGANLTCYPTNITCDRQGNIFVLASYFGAAAFGVAGNFICSNYTSPVQSKRDILLIKLTSQGNVLWVKTITGITLHFDENVKATALVVDANGNPWVGGSFCSRVDVDSYSLSSQSDLNGFVVKYDRNGNVVDVLHLATNGRASVEGLQADNHGNVYAAGQAFGYVSFGALLDTIPTQNFFVLKLDPLVQPRLLQTTNNSQMTSWLTLTGFARRPNGDYVLVGQMQNAATFGGITLPSVPVNKPDVCIVACDSTGHVLWAQSGSSSGWDKLNAVFYDSLGGVVIAGQHRQPINIAGALLPTTPDSVSGFIVRYSAQGTATGATAIRSSRNVWLPAMTNSSGRAYVVGNFTGQINFTTSSLVSAGSKGDYFIACYQLNRLTGLPADSNPVTWAMYPNPVTLGQSIHLDSSQPFSPGSTVIITDVLGRERLKTVLPTGVNKVVLSTDLLTPGVYAATVLSGQLKIMKKFAINY